MGEATFLSLRQAVAKNIRLIRQERGWSQEQLADESGLHRTYVSSVERGERNVSLDNIQKIATALGVEPYYLLQK